MKYYIYCATNKLNQKSYIGQTSNFEYRKQCHIYDAFRETEKAKDGQRKHAFQNAIAKYGTENFNWLIIEECETLDDINEAEEFYIAYFQTLSPNGYNILKGGNNRTLLATTKEKIRQKLKIVSSFVGKKGKDHPNFGKKFSEERKQKQSKLLSGDNAPGKKINSQIARQIYIDYIQNINETAVSLGLKYSLAKNTICNILNKKSWKDATNDLPDINLSNRTCGENWIKSKLKEQDVINIRNNYNSKNYTMQQ